MEATTHQCKKCNNPKTADEMVKGRKICKDCERKRVNHYYHPKNNVSNFILGAEPGYFDRQPFGWVF